MLNTICSLQTPWCLAFLCIFVREQHVRRAEGRVETPKCVVTQRMCLPPHTVVPVESPDLSLVAASSKSNIPDDFEVTPLLVGPDETTKFLIIELLNKVNESHWIQPGCIVGFI